MPTRGKGAEEVCLLCVPAGTLQPTVLVPEEGQSDRTLNKAKAEHGRQRLREKAEGTAAVPDKVRLPPAHRAAVLL